MSASTIPAVVVKFLNLAAAALDNVQIGPPTTNKEMDGLYLFADSDGAAPLPFQQTWASLGTLARNEEYEIPCLLFVRTGDNDAASLLTLLTSVTSNFQTIAGLFRPAADLGISGNTIRAQVTSGDMWILPTPQGLLAKVPFTVTVEARI